MAGNRNLRRFNGALREGRLAPAVNKGGPGVLAAKVQWRSATTLIFSQRAIELSWVNAGRRDGTGRSRATATVPGGAPGASCPWAQQNATNSRNPPNLTLGAAPDFKGAQTCCRFSMHPERPDGRSTKGCRAHFDPGPISQAMTLPSQHPWRSWPRSEPRTSPHLPCPLGQLRQLRNDCSDRIGHLRALVGGRVVVLEHV